jgi:hypothetical protein
VSLPVSTLDGASSLWRTFNTGVSEGHGETNPTTDFGLQDVTTEGKRDFSNPMYEAYGQLESQATADAVNYSIPSGGSSSGP